MTLSDNITKGDGEELVCHVQDIKAFIKELKSIVFLHSINWDEFDEEINKLAGRELI